MTTFPDPGARAPRSGRPSSSASPFLRVAGLAASLAALPGLAAAQNNPSSLFLACRSAKAPAEKVDACSAVIRATGSPRMLESARDIRGLAYMELGAFDKATSDFTVVIGFNPRASAYWDNREAAYRMNGRLKEALKDANVAVGLAPKFAFVYRGRGNVYKDLGQIDLALADFDTALGLTPNDGALYVDRGKVYRQAGKTDEAIGDFTRALELNRKWRDALKERGLTYKAAGKKELALADLKDYVKTNPADVVALQALQDLGEKVEFPAAQAEPEQAHEQEAVPDATLLAPAPSSPAPAPAPAPLRPAPTPSVPPPKSPPADAGPSAGPTAVSLHEDHGTFVVPVTINGQLTLDFTVDSGASDVVVSKDVFRTLLRANTVASSDLLDERTYELADGSTIRSQRFTIRSLKVGDRVLNRVEGSVTASNGSLLLGQTFLTRFKSWSFDNQRKVLLLQ